MPQPSIAELREQERQIIVAQSDAYQAALDEVSKLRRRARNLAIFICVAIIFLMAITAYKFIG